MGIASQSTNQNDVWKDNIVICSHLQLIAPSLTLKCYVCDGPRNACMGSAEDLGTLTECPERDDRCVTFYGWFTGDWKYNYYGSGPWDETTPLVARYCAAQEDFDYDYYYYNGDYPEDSGPGCTDGTMENFGNNPGKDLVQVTCTFDVDGGNDQTSVEYPLPE